MWLIKETIEHAVHVDEERESEGQSVGYRFGALLDYLHETVLNCTV